MTGCTGLGTILGTSAHLQNSLSGLPRVWKKHVCEGSSGHGACAPQAVVPSRLAASSTAPSSSILPCGDRGRDRISPTGAQHHRRVPTATLRSIPPSPGEARPVYRLFFPSSTSSTSLIPVISEAVSCFCARKHGAPSETPIQRDPTHRSHPHSAYGTAPSAQHQPCCSPSGAVTRWKRGKARKRLGHGQTKPWGRGDEVHTPATLPKGCCRQAPTPGCWVRLPGARAGVATEMGGGEAATGIGVKQPRNGDPAPLRSTEASSGVSPHRSHNHFQVPHGFGSSPGPDPAPWWLPG